MIAVGKVLKAQGIKGEVKIGCYSGESQQLKHVTELEIGNIAYKVKTLRTDGEFCYVLLVGINDRNTAEELRNAEVYAEREALTIKKDSYFVEDVVGSKIVLDSGEIIGTIVEVLQYGTADVFCCKNAEKSFSFPFLKDLVISVNVLTKTVELKAKRFAEVVCYDEN